MGNSHVPIYEYRCQDCSHELEALQKISDPKLTTCPACGKEALTKLVSASAFVLKGSGWYATDFKDQPKAAKGNGKDESKSDDTAKSDSGEAKSGKAGEKPGETSGKKSTDKPGDKATDKSDKKSQSKSEKSDSKPQKKAAGD